MTSTAGDIGIEALRATRTTFSSSAISSALVSAGRPAGVDEHEIEVFGPGAFDGFGRRDRRIRRLSAWT